MVLQFKLTALFVYVDVNRREVMKDKQLSSTYVSHVESQASKYIMWHS